MKDFDEFDSEMKAQMKRAWLLTVVVGSFWAIIGGVVVWGIIRFVIHYTS